MVSGFKQMCMHDELIVSCSVRLAPASRWAPREWPWPEVVSAVLASFGVQNQC